LEILVRDLFRPLLPAHIGVGAGHIIDSNSVAQSKEMDVIIYDRSIIPPVLIDGELGFFPIESVLYVIEVKTKLSAAELKGAHESVRDFRLNFEFFAKDRVECKKYFELAHYVVFSLDSDLTGNGKSEADRYREIYGDKPYIGAICVAGGECWIDQSEKWVGSKDNEPYDGVLRFIGAVVDTYRRVAESRSYAKISRYITPKTLEMLPSIDR
jgi:hypothetical protein